MHLRALGARLPAVAVGLLIVGAMTGSPKSRDHGQGESVAAVEASPSSTVASHREARTRPIGPGVKGWRITTRNIGLARFGLSCDSLPPYRGSSSPAAGTRIVGKLVTQPLDLSAGRITIRRSCIRPTSTGYHNEFLVTTTSCDDGCRATRGGRVVISDSEISGFGMAPEQVATSCAFLGVGTVRRTLIHGMGSGICFFETGPTFPALAQQNYVTDLRAAGDSHNEAATVRDFNGGPSTRRAQFVNNRLAIYLEGHTSGALFIQPTWESINRLDVTGNLFEGIGYNLFVTGTLEGESGTYSDLNAVNNRFLSVGYGPAAVDAGPGWDVWRDNHRYNSAKPRGTGALVRAP